MVQSMKTGCRLIEQDRLMIAVVDEHGKLIRQGKRVRSYCSLNHEERKFYVKNGLVKTIRYIKETRDVSLREAKDLMDLGLQGKISKHWKPRHEHNCLACIPLGVFGEFDLYYCRQHGQPTVIARSGPAGEYTSGLNSKLPELKEAQRRAKEANLL